MVRWILDCLPFRSRRQDLAAAIGVQDLRHQEARSCSTMPEKIWWLSVFFIAEPRAEV